MLAVFTVTYLLVRKLNAFYILTSSVFMRIYFSIQKMKLQPLGLKNLCSGSIYG